MTTKFDTLGRTARRTTMLAVPLLVAATGTAAAHGGYGGGYGGGMMGGGAMGSGGWGLFGGAMGLLWMVLLLAVPAYLGYLLVTRDTDDDDDEPLTILRERYARGELSDDEFEQRREQLL